MSGFGFNNGDRVMLHKTTCDCGFPMCFRVEVGSIGTVEECNYVRWDCQPVETVSDAFCAGNLTLWEEVTGFAKDVRDYIKGELGG